REPMKKTILAAALLALATSSQAHHSFSAQYDADQPVMLQGTVTKFEWTNPHARLYIDVLGENGEATNWNIELGSPNFLSRAGWSRNDLKIGDKVTVDGSKARSGADMANARSIVLSDGRQVFGRNAADNF